MKVRYPFLDLKDTHCGINEELMDAIRRVVESGRYIGGEECLEFENTLARITGTRYCVGVSNGLDALRLIFRAYIELGRLAPGDEVIVPANTYIASVLAVTDNALKPVFVEPEEDSLNLDWDAVEKAVTAKTKAVLTVHLYGRISWNERVVDNLKKRDILIVEDNAQAIGAMTTQGIRSGALGDAAAFSFYPTKNIGALGDAGAVTTDDEALAKMVRALSNYGSDYRYHNIVRGYNCRLDPIQAAVLSLKLRGLEAEILRRTELAGVYNDTISNPKVKLPMASASDMVWHQYVVRVDNRDDFTRFLDENGVGWDIHYSTPPHRQPCYSEYAGLTLPIADALAASVVSLPLGAGITREDARAIAAIINRF